MTILIDGRAFVASTAGISNFLKDVIQTWAWKCPNDSFRIVLPKATDETFAHHEFPQNVSLTEESNWLFRKLPNLVWLICMMPVLARKWKADIYYTPVPCLPFLLPKDTKKIIVVHDVVNIEYQQTMQWTNRLANSLFFSRSIKKADIIWTNSNYTRDKVEQYFPKRQCKDIFTGDAADRNVFRRMSVSEHETQIIRQKYGIADQFILFVGSLEPRKNLAFLLSLMPELYQQTKVQLVVVGAKGWKNSQIKDLIDHPHFPQESTVFCGFVPNDDLVRLYNIAQCFVSAALNEGFGMPQLEAMLCGCPIVTAHNSAMIEVAEGKDGAITVKGYDEKTWIGTIIQVIKQCPEVNLSQLAAYDWDVIVDNFLKSRL